MVNGFKTEKINIEQSVKQGDALSCSLFIICMDPLIRKVNSDQTIQGLNIGNPTTIDKLCAYADDIIFIIKDNCISHWWKTILTPESKSNTLTVVFLCGQKSWKPQNCRDLWAFFLWLSTCYHWLVDMNSLKYYIKKNKNKNKNKLWGTLVKA